MATATKQKLAPTDISYEDFRAAIVRRGWCAMPQGRVQMALKNGTLVVVTFAKCTTFRAALQHLKNEHRRLQTKIGD